MTKCLLSLGSNIGDREATLREALTQIAALPDVQVLKHSEFLSCKPIGGPAGQEEILNAAVVCETTVPPLRLLSELQQIEARHGRQRAERWAPRTLDIDMLLYGNEVAETEMLTLPHPRLTFRRFVLEPSAEIAPRMLHPTIGWPIERLLLHLSAASDRLAIVSPSDSIRGRIESALIGRNGVAKATAPEFATAPQFWINELTTWLTMASRGTSPAIATGGLPYAAAEFPKLTILIDAKAEIVGAAAAQWSSFVRRPGRGPTLRLQTSDESTIDAEVFAAIESVWPDLGPAGANRIK